MSMYVPMAYDLVILRYHQYSFQLLLSYFHPFLLFPIHFHCCCFIIGQSEATAPTFDATEVDTLTHTTPLLI